MKPDLIINTQSYFGDHFYYTGWAALILAIPVIFITWYVGVIFLLTGIVVTTSHYKLSIDQNTKQIREYLLIFGMKRAVEIKKYTHLSYITIKSSRYSQQLQLRAASTVVEGTMYSAYLITDTGHIYLGESKRKEKISRKARGIAEKLGIEFHDLEDEEE